jgi:hypothetical protein
MGQALLLATAALLLHPAVPLRAADRPHCLGRVVNASCWGWSATDSDLNSAALQAAILSGAEKVIVPRMAGPWVVNVSMARDSPYEPVHGCTPAWDAACCTPSGPGAIALPDGSNPPCCITPGQEFTNCSSQWRAAIYLPGNSTAGTANDTQIFFEPGVEVVAQRGSFYGQQDCLFLSMDASNVTLTGYGASLRMWKADYQRTADTPAGCTAVLTELCDPSSGTNACLACAGAHVTELAQANCEDGQIRSFCSAEKLYAPYKGSQYRFATNWYRGDRIRIFGLAIRDSGGDGIDFGGGPPAMTNVHVKDVTLDGHHRQGMSICGGMVNLLVEDTVMSNTMGHAPGCGLDIEFDHDDSIVKNMTFRNVRFVNNSNCGISISPSALSYDPATQKFDHPNHMDAKFVDCVVDLRGQHLTDGQSGPGVSLSDFTRALKGDVEFTRLRVIGGVCPAVLSLACDSQGVQTTFRDSIFERNANGAVDFKPPWPLPFPSVRVAPVGSLRACDRVG